MVDRFDMVKFDSVVDCVCRVMSLDKKELDIRKRDRVLVDARRIIANIMMNGEICSISGLARSMGKNHATALYSLRKFEYDILGSPLNKKMYTKCVEVFESVGDVYSSVDERDLMIDELKNKITDLQLRLKDAKPYREEVEVLVDLVNKIPSQHIETAEFRILTMLKVFKIAPKNQETKVIGSYETTGSF